MYKLFLTLRYLTRKKIVLFPILAIWLCVMMMIIVASIMGGFVERAQQVNRDLNGDLAITGLSFAGWPYYEELGDALHKKFPDIVDWTPLVRGYGLINLPDRGATRGVQVVGVDPVGRAKVSKFRQSLFRQYQVPIQAADDLADIGLPKTGRELQQLSLERSNKAWHALDTIRFSDPAELSAAPQPIWWAASGLLIVLAIALWALGRKHRRTVWSVTSSLTILLIGSALVALIVFWPMIFPAASIRSDDQRQQVQLNAYRLHRTAQLAATLNPTTTYATKQQLLDQLLPPAPSFNVPAEASIYNGGPENTPTNGCYVGVEFGLTRRDQRGNFHRPPDADFIKVFITVVPISQAGSIKSAGNAHQEPFIITDDFYTGVIDVDKQDVYASFDVVQDMAGMRSDLPKEDPGYFPSRCNDILIKLKPNTPLAQMEKIRDQIDDFIADFRKLHPEIPHLEVLTWEQQQKTYLDAVKNEKVMITFILLLMSGVVLVVIFLIFYMIVRDKTRDIGIIKAVGGSEEGVAAIFLSYGIFIGLVGGILGVISGVAFVQHTNQIHDLIFQLTGHMIWDRKVYLFDRIPDTVNPTEVAIYFALALAAGILGALIPAIVAGSEDPVKAVRYE